MNLLGAIFFFNPLGLVFLGFGVFTLCAAGMDWEWFMGHYKARFLISLLGRTGARIFYAFLGAFLLVLGVLLTLGILRDNG